MRLVAVEDDDAFDAFRNAFGDCKIHGQDEDGIKSVRWRLDNTVLALDQTTHGQGNRYRDVIGGLDVVPSRLIEAPL